MARKHIMIYPGSGVDFLRAERSYDGIYLRSSQSHVAAAFIAVRLPVSAQVDFSFSSFRPCQWATRIPDAAAVQTRRPSRC